MNFIPSIVLSSVLLLTLTACNSGNEAPKPKDTQSQTSENSTADANETPHQSEEDFPPVDKSFLEDEPYNAEETGVVKAQVGVRVSGVADLIDIVITKSNLSAPII